LKGIFDLEACRSLVCPIYFENETRAVMEINYTFF
jgi:hypothetical protein